LLRRREFPGWNWEVGSHCIWSPPGRLVLGQPSTTSPTRSSPFRSCSSGWNGRGRWSPSTPWDTQIDSAEKIVGRGGDYLLALKANRPLLHRDVVAFFDDPPADMLEPEHNTTDGDHGYWYQSYTIGPKPTAPLHHPKPGRSQADYTPKPVKAA
jgi:hypothetical protein